jgi:hypothetical protein
LAILAQNPLKIAQKAHFELFLPIFSSKPLKIAQNPIFERF